MASQKTRALTLRLTDYRETSQILSVYSREAGRISLIAKGAKRKRRGTQGTIDRLQLVELVYLDKPGARLHLMTECSLLDDFRALRRDLSTGYAAFFLAELLLGVTEENDPSPELFDLSVEALGLLCRTDRPTEVVHAFEVRLLHLTGLLPRLDACAWCGGGLGNAHELAFSATSGGVLCAKCHQEVSERISVSRGAVAVMHKLADTPLNKVERLRISGRIGSDVRKMLARLWMHTLGREPRMLKYLWNPS
jgi:DNA repair protein RecO (recombination protein O)